jgi:hypothetical protein
MVCNQPLRAPWYLIVAVWFSFCSASGRQKQKLEPNAQLLALILTEALR